MYTMYIIFGACVSDSVSSGVRITNSTMFLHGFTSVGDDDQCMLFIHVCIPDLRRRMDFNVLPVITRAATVCTASHRRNHLAFNSRLGSIE